MKKTFQKELVYCDHCNREIRIREHFKNDGSFQKDYITLHDKDICGSCSLEVLDKLSKNINKENIDKIFEKRKSNNLILDLEDKIKVWS